MSPSDTVSRRVLLQRTGLIGAAALLGDRLSAQTDGKQTLRRSTPEAEGVSSDAILAFIDAVEQKVGGLHSFMLLRHGRMVAEGWWTPYAPGLKHMLYSLSKSFTSTAVGFAVAEGVLHVDDNVIAFFPDKIPTGASENLAAMKVKHLLTMNTGHEHDATGPITAAADGDWVKAFLSLPVEHAPGSKFVYNSAATYMCSAIVQKLTGQPIVRYLQPRLFDPLGIKDQTWETCPRGINCGGWGLSVKTVDIARFGQCYLQKGKWGGQQLVPEAWVQDATMKQVSNGDGGASDWTQGYGYQFWRCRHNAFRGDGAFGQYCLVMPEQDAVLAITSGVGDMQAVLNAVWDHLLPGMQSAGGDAAKLRDRALRLEVSPPAGSGSSPTAGRVSGKAYRVEANADRVQTVTFDFHGADCTITLRGEGGEQKISAGGSSWRGSEVRVAGPPRLGAPPAGRIASRGAWSEPDTYTAKVCYVETPYVETVSCHFQGDSVTITRKMNVSFGPTGLPTLEGRAA